MLDIFNPNIGHPLFIAVAESSHVGPDYQVPYDRGASIETACASLFLNNSKHERVSGKTFSLPVR